MGTPLDQFDDPNLKAALKAQLAGERAPDGLRHRIQGLVEQDAESAETSTRNRSFWRRGPLLALAASMLIGATVVAVLLRKDSGSAVTQDLLLAMVSTHNVCCTHPHHRHPEIDQNDFSNMRRQASGRLNHPVAAAQLEGWIFDGIYLCNVGTTPSAHLMYHRGSDRLSIFSVAHPSSAGKPSYVAKQLDDRLIAATVKSGTAFAVVAHPLSPSLQLSDIQALLKQQTDPLPSQVVALATMNPQAFRLPLLRLP